MTSLDWKKTSVTMTDRAFQPEVVKRVNALLTLGYKVSYATFNFQSPQVLPLPSTVVWDRDFDQPDADQIDQAFGLIATLKLLDKVIDNLSKSNAAKPCQCSSQDLLWFGCRC